jgi:hypothetical protein
MQPLLQPRRGKRDRAHGHPFTLHAKDVPRLQMRVAVIDRQRGSGDRSIDFRSITQA